MKLKFVPQEHGEVEVDTDEMLYAVVDTEDGEIFGIFLTDERAQEIIEDRGDLRPEEGGGRRFSHGVRYLEHHLLGW